MQSWEAIRRCVERDTEIVADALHLATVTVRRWKEDPAGSGSRNPLDHVRIMIETALEAGRNPADAMAPFVYLQECFADMSAAAGATLQDVFASLVEETGHLLREYAVAIRDGKIVPDERRRLQKETSHLRAELDNLDRMLREMEC